MTGPRLTGAAGAAGWAVGFAVAVGLAVAAVALQWAGQGPLAAPPLTDPARFGAWLDARDPVVAAFAVVRLVAVGALWYLVFVTALGTVLRMAGAVSLVRMADRVTVGPVRRMLAGSVTLGLAASGVVAVAAPALRVPVAAVGQPTPSTTAPPPATVTMHLLSPSERSGPPAVVPGPGVRPATTEPARRWTVKPGECFWSIAESVLTESSGRVPTDAEIVPYWRRLIDANRSQLAQERDPDLIFPGQIFTVPAP